MSEATRQFVLGADVTLNLQDGVATVALARPSTGNAVNLSMAQQLISAVAAVASADQVGAMVLHGEGPNFCVGGDIVAFAQPDPGGRLLHEVASALHEAILAIRSLPIPVLAAVQGACAGGGLGLALACDLVIADVSSKFVSAYTRVGLSPDCGTSWLLTQRLGAARAADMILTNRALDGAEAAAYGLISRVTEPGQALATASELAAQLAQGPRQAQASAARLVRRAPERSLSEHLVEEAALIAQCRSTAEGAEGVTAFVAKRRPNFTDARPSAPGRGVLRLGVEQV